MKKLIGIIAIALMTVGVTYAQGIQEERNQAESAPRAERQRIPQQQQQNNRPMQRGYRGHHNKHPMQQQRTPQRQNFPGQQHETVTLSGVLKLEKGFIAVQSSEKTYLVPMLNRYLGFINGLQEGKNVTIEGFNLKRGNVEILCPQKLKLEDKEYDFRPAAFMQGWPQQHAPQQRLHAPRKFDDRTRNQHRRIN